MFRSSFIKTGSRHSGEFSNTSPNSSPSSSPSSSPIEDSKSKSFLLRGTSFVGGFSQSFSLPKRQQEVDPLDSSIRRNSEVTQRLPSPSIAEPVEVDKNLVSIIKSWAFEGKVSLPECLNPNFKPKIQKEEKSKDTRKRPESVVIDEKKSFNELFDSLFSSSSVEEPQELKSSPTATITKEESDKVSSPPNTPPSSILTGGDPKATPPKGGLKSLLFGKKYKPTTTATASNIPTIKDTPKPQNPYRISHVPLMDEQFDNTGFKLELTDFQIMENFKDVSRYNRRKDIDEQKRMKNQLMESSKNQKTEETSDDSVLEREDDFITFDSESNSPLEKSQEELLKKKKFIEKEIMETEIGYVRHLVNLFEYYLLPIRKAGILSRENYQIVFKNINMILAINTTLLREFEKVYYSPNSSESLTSIFSTRVPALKLYVGYVNTYPSAIKCLNEILTKDPLFDSWEKSQRNIEVNGVKLFPLRSYIALPLQRITRYFLLFNDLLETLDGDDYYSLSAIIDDMKALSAYCIEKKNESDNLETLLEFQKKLKLKDLVRGDRTFLREGVGSADNGDTNVELYLFSDLLVYVMSNEAKRVVKEVALKAGNLIELTKVSTTTVMLSFQNEKTYITFDSEDELKIWISAINEQMNSSITKARIRRRGNSSTPLEEKIVFAGYLAKSKGLSKKTRFHTLSSSGGVKYYDKPNGEMKGSYQIKGSKIFKKSPTTFLLTTDIGKSFFYSTENDSIASTWINRFIGLGAVIMKQ